MLKLDFFGDGPFTVVLDEVSGLVLFVDLQVRFLFVFFARFSKRSKMSSPCCSSAREPPGACTRNGVGPRRGIDRNGDSERIPVTLF